MKFKDVMQFIKTEACADDMVLMFRWLRYVVTPWKMTRDRGEPRYVRCNLHGEPIVSVSRVSKEGRWAVREHGTLPGDRRKTYRKCADAKNAADHRLMQAGYHKVLDWPTDKSAVSREYLLMGEE